MTLHSGDAFGSFMCLRWKLIGSTRGGGGGGGIVTGLPASYLFVYLFYHRSKSMGGGIKMAAAISTVEAAIFTIIK